MRLLVDTLADILAPRVCLGCADEGSWLCRACADGIPRDLQATCIGCRRLSPFGSTCERCRPSSCLNGVIAAASYTDPLVRRIIQTTKYAPAHDVAGAFVTLLERVDVHAAAAHFFREPSTVLIIPVPLHWRRMSRRGFNQSEVIARTLVAMEIGTLAPLALRRRRRMTPQVDLPHEARFANVTGVFVVREPDRIRGREILLVDDVVTTGATMAACAHELRASGARRVAGFAIARG